MIFREESRLVLLLQCLQNAAPVRSRDIFLPGLEFVRRIDDLIPVSAHVQSAGVIWACEYISRSDYAV